MQDDLLNEVLVRLKVIDHKLDLIIQKEDTMSAVITQNLLQLQQQVTATTQVEQSAVTLIQGIASQLATAIAAEGNGDDAALPALQASLQTSAAALAAAITANTPAAPANPVASPKVVPTPTK
jgi:small-conductance mechanosensitive channel